MGTGFVGRVAELAEAQKILASAEHRALVVRGEAGVGKTTLIGQLLGGATSQTRWLKPSSGSKELAFSTVAPLLPPGFAPSGANVGLETIIAVRDAIAALGGPSGRLVVGVDDLQNVDQASASLLVQATLADEMFLLGTLRDGQECSEPFEALWTDSGVAFLRVPGLAEAETRELAAELLGFDIDSTAGEILYRRTLGNPLYARELVRAVSGRAEISPATGIGSLLASSPPGERLIDLVLGRIRGLPREAREILELIALAEPLDLELLSSAVAADVPMQRLLRELEEQALVRSANDPDGRISYSLDHPMQGEVLKTHCPLPMQRDMYRRIADAMDAKGLAGPDDIIRFALYRNLSGTSAAPTAISDAARLASASYNARLAEQLTESAGEDILILLALADAQHRLGKYTQAAETLRRIEQGGVIHPSFVVGLTSLALYNQFWGLNESDEAIAGSLRALDGLQGPARIEMQALHCLMLTFSGRHSEVLDFLDGLDVLDEALRPLLTPYLFALAASGRALTALEILRPMLADADGSEHPVSVPWQLGLAVQIGHRLGWDREPSIYDATIEPARRIYDAGLRYSEPEAMASAVAMLGSEAHERGRIATSARLFQESISAFDRPDWIGITQWKYGGAGLGLLELGRLKEARELLANRPAVRANEQWYSYLEHIADAWILFADGMLDAAEEKLTEFSEQLLERGDRYFAVVVRYHLVRLCSARNTSDFLVPLGDVVEGRQAQLFARHSLAWDAADAEALERVGADFAELDYPLYAAEAFAQAAYRYRQSGMRSQEAAAIRLSREYASRCEGASTPALRLAESSPIDKLTRSERQVAALAARGLSSPEIASTLVVSVRTVDSHLGRVYSKLGIGGRGELRDFFA